MSEPDDPFGRRERTIIRPNPGGRRPSTPAGGAPPAATPTSPVAYPPPPGAAPPPYSPPHAPPPTQQAPVNWDGWVTTTPTPPGVNPYMQQQVASAPMTPAPSAPHISYDLVEIAANPLMRAAASLLLLLGR